MLSPRPLRLCGESSIPKSRAAARALLSPYDAPKIRDSFMKVRFDKANFFEAQRSMLGFGVYSGPIGLQET